MKRLSAICLAVLLAACASDPVVTSTRYRVVLPEESMYSCETVSQFPNPRTLTDLQVARLLVDLHQNNVRCRNSMDAIRQFLEDAKVRIETGEEAPARPTPQRRVPIRP